MARVLLWVSVAGCLSGCAGPERVDEPVVRRIAGKTIEGNYVSPAAYQYYLEAELRRGSGQLGEAAQSLHYAVTSDPASAYLHAQLGEVLLEQGKLDEATQEVERALALDSQFPEALIAGARVKATRGDLVAAESLARKALNIDRQNETAYLFFVDFYGRQKKAEARADAWRQFSENSPVVALRALRRTLAAETLSIDERVYLESLCRSIEKLGKR